MIKFITGIWRCGKKRHDEKSKYLKDLFAKTYMTDVQEHNRIANDQPVLEDQLNVVPYSVGLLTKSY